MMIFMKVKMMIMIIMRMMKMKMLMMRMMVMVMTFTNPFFCAKLHCKVNLCLAARSHLGSIVGVRIRMTMMVIMGMGMMLPAVTLPALQCIVGVRMVDGDCRGQDQERC